MANRKIIHSGSMLHVHVTTFFDAKSFRKITKILQHLVILCTFSAQMNLGLVYGYCTLNGWIENKIVGHSLSFKLKQLAETKESNI